MMDSLDLGPIPYQFNPLWLQEKTIINLIIPTWSQWIVGSLVFVWEKKVKATKLVLKEWEKHVYSPPERDKEEYISLLIVIQEKLDKEMITSCLVKRMWFIKNIIRLL
jgi:hypothetical protein